MIHENEDIKALFARYRARRADEYDEDEIEDELPPDDDAILSPETTARLLELTAQGVRARPACLLLGVDRGALAYALARGRHDLEASIDSPPARYFAGWQAAKLRFARWCLDRARVQAEGGRDKGAREALWSLMNGGALPATDSAPDALEPYSEAIDDESLDDWMGRYRRLAWNWP